MASFNIGPRILLTANPADSLTSTGSLPISLAISMILATCSSVESSPRITSTSCITGAGLKKCMPMTGRLRPLLISVTEREDVLDANIQFAGTMLSSSLKVSFFICIFSLTASMIRSASLKISFVPIVILSSIAFFSLSVIFPFLT